MLSLSSTVIPGLRSCQDFWSSFIFSPRHVRVWEIGPSLQWGEGLVFLWRCRICFTIVLAWGYPCCHGVLVIMATVHLLSLHYSKQHSVKVKVKVTLRLMVSWPVSLDVKVYLGPKTTLAPLPRIPPLLSNVWSGLLPSNSLGVADAEE
jgi:hypothetical protein